MLSEVSTGVLLAEVTERMNATVKETNASLFLDIPSLYHKCNTEFSGKVDYSKIISLLKNSGYDLRYMAAYTNEANAGFKTFLEHIGISVHNSRFSHDFQLVMDATHCISDTVIFATSDRYCRALINTLKLKNKRVVLVGVSIPDKIKRLCHSYFEITEDFIIPLNIFNEAIVLDE